MAWKHPTGGQPEVVNIVALGPTNRSYHALHLDYTPLVPPADETWTLNKGLRTTLVDMGFIMDDLVGEARKSDRYRHDIDNLEVPIMTSIIDNDVRKLYPKLIEANLLGEFPIDEVLDWIGARVLLAGGHTKAELQLKPQMISDVGEKCGYYLHNSIPFMIAYALFIGCRKIHLFGADYTYPGMVAREDDRANTEYWCGMARAFGVEVTTPQDTTLLNMNQGTRIYGYGARPPIRNKLQPDGARALLDRLVPSEPTIAEVLGDE